MAPNRPRVAAPAFAPCPGLPSASAVNRDLAGIDHHPAPGDVLLLRSRSAGRLLDDTTQGHGAGLDAFLAGSDALLQRSQR